MFNNIMLKIKTNILQTYGLCYQRNSNNKQSENLKIRVFNCIFVFIFNVKLILYISIKKLKTTIFQIVLNQNTRSLLINREKSWLWQLQIALNQP